MADLCTLADLENVLFAPVPTERLDEADAAIGAASEVIRGFCRQRLSYVVAEQVLLSGSACALYLPELPVVAVAAVAVGGVPSDPTTYAFDAVTGRLWSVAVGGDGLPYPTDWVSGWRNVAVTYDHGYVVVPEDVANVCARVASRQYLGGLRAVLVGPHAREADYTAIFQGESITDTAGAYGPTSAVLLTGDERRALARYRSPRFG